MSSEILQLKSSSRNKYILCKLSSPGGRETGRAAGGAGDPIPQGGFVRQLADMANDFEIRGLGKLTGQGFIRAGEDEAVAKQAGVPLLVQPVKGRASAGTQFGREMGGVRKSEPPCARAAREREPPPVRGPSSPKLFWACGPRGADYNGDPVVNVIISIRPSGSYLTVCLWYQDQLIGDLPLYHADS